MNAFWREFRMWLPRLLHRGGRDIRIFLTGIKDFLDDVLPLLFPVWVLSAFAWGATSSPSRILTLVALSFFPFVFVAGCVIFVRRMVAIGRQDIVVVFRTPRSVPSIEEGGTNPVGSDFRRGLRLFLGEISRNIVTKRDQFRSGLLVPLRYDAIKVKGVLKSTVKTVNYHTMKMFPLLFMSWMLLIFWFGIDPALSGSRSLTLVIVWFSVFVFVMAGVAFVQHMMLHPVHPVHALRERRDKKSATRHFEQ